MQRICDLCDNPPKYKCMECQSEIQLSDNDKYMLIHMTGSHQRASLALAHAFKSINGQHVPSDFMYV